MLIFIGDLMVDVFRDLDEDRRHIGGKAAIWAATAAAIGQPSTALGAVGRDGAGDEIQHVLDVCGVRTDMIEVVDEPTGADFFEQGDWQMERGANWAYRPTDVETALDKIALEGTSIDGVVIGQGLARETTEAALREARRRGWPIVLNLGPEADEPSRRIDPALFSLADVLTVNRREAPFLYEDLGLTEDWSDFRGLGRILVAATQPASSLILLGSTFGAYAWVRDGVSWHEISVGAVADPVPDPEFSIGAGDSMLATVVARVASSRSGLRNPTLNGLEVALQFGALVAAFNHGFAGTMTAVTDHAVELRGVAGSPLA